MSKKSNKAVETAAVEEKVPFEVDDLVETAIVTAPELPAGLAPVDASEYEYGDEYAGSEMKLKSDEIIIPMIRIVQSGSGIWTNRNEETFEGKVGDLYNTITSQIFDAEKGLLLVPIREVPCVIEREPAPKNTFLAKHPVDEKRVQEALAANNGDWRQLTGRGADGKTKVVFNYTMEVYCAVIDPADGVTATGVVLVPFSGANLFQRKKWWFAMGEVLGAGNTPKYAFRTLLKTVYRPAKDGRVDYYAFEAHPYGGNWSRCRLGKSQKATLDRCKEFEKLLDSGALGKADYSEPEVSETDTENSAFTVDGKAAF